MIELGLADGSLIDELMELTAQSIGHLEIQEHFNVIKEIGRGKYGKVLLVTHRNRGMVSRFYCLCQKIMIDKIMSLQCHLLGFYFFLNLSVFSKRVQYFQLPEGLWSNK